jgi:predicted RecA/RadA family phage recombinase
MSQCVDGQTKTFVADEAIAINLRVKLDSDGKVTVAGLADKEIGTAVTPAFAAGDRVTVRLRTAAGTHKMIAVEALAVGATLYTEAAGKVQDTAASTAFQVGVALEAAAADGDVIEVLYNAHGDTAVS